MNRKFFPRVVVVRAVDYFFLIQLYVKRITENIYHKTFARKIIGALNNFFYFKIIFQIVQIKYFKMVNHSSHFFQYIYHGIEFVGEKKNFFLSVRLDLQYITDLPTLNNFYRWLFVGFLIYSWIFF